MKRVMIALLVLFAVNGAYAHNSDQHPDDSIVASEVDLSSESDVRAFLEHFTAHWKEEIIVERFHGPLLEIRTAIRTEGSEWKSDDVYIVRMNAEGTNISLHPYHFLAQGGYIDDEAGVGQGITMEALDNYDEAQCRSYTYDGEDRVACAIQIPSYRNTRQLFMAGMLHDFEDVKFDKLECDDFVPGTTAADVVDEQTLQDFVRDAAFYYVHLFRNEGGAGILRSYPCQRRPPWRHESIYLFRSSVEGRVIFHGVSPIYENRIWDRIEDKAGNNVTAMLREAASSLGPLEGTFVEYYWDDPADPNDDVDTDLCTEGALTCSPGTSFKRTYLVMIPGEVSGTSGDYYIAAGIYPDKEEAEEGGDGGCSIASGKTNWPNVLINLVFLFFVVVWILVKSRVGKSFSP